VKRISICLLVSAALLAPHAVSCIEIGEVSVVGSNRLEYWFWRETKEEVLDDRFDLCAYYRDFLLGFRYQVVEPSNVNFAERREGFYRRYVEYDAKRFGIRAGNYYTTFGRGLAFSAYEDDVIFLDRDVDGVKLRGSTDWADLVAISGRPRNTEFSQLQYAVVNDTTDQVRGGGFLVYPVPYVTAGASYVLLTAKDLFDPLIFRRTEVYAANASFSLANFDMYGEVAKKWGWDELLLGQGTGYGLYGSASVSLPGYGLTVQFADYDSIGLGGFTYRYNNPPVLNRYGQSINRGLDETGYQVEAYASPVEPLNIGLSYSDIETADDTLSFREMFAEAKYERYGLFELRAEFDRTEQHGIISGAADWQEQIPGLEGTFYITPVHSVGAGYEHRMVTFIIGADSLDVEEDFTDQRLHVSYTYGTYGTLTLTGELRDKELEEKPGKEWRSAQVDLDITQNHRLTMMVGSEKGGFVCSGGICRYEPPFDGVKVLLTSRF
jgi:hypothetical protein